MLDFTVWYASDDALVSDDVESWRHETSGLGSEPCILYNAVPVRGSSEWRTLFQPPGLFGDVARVVVIWGIRKVKPNDLAEFLTTASNANGISIRVALVTNGKLPKKVADLNPREYSYGLVNEKDPVRWADTYLRDSIAATFTDDAYDRMELVAASDVNLVASTVAQLCKRGAGDADLDKSDTLAEIDRESVDEALSGLGQGDFIDMVSAVEKADLPAVVDLSLRMTPNATFGLLELQRKRMTALAIRDSGVPAKEAKEIFRNHASERAKMEDKRQALVDKGKEMTDADRSKIAPEYMMSPKQLDFLYRNGAEYNAAETAAIWKAIATADFDVKSGQMTTETLRNFCTTVALVNKVAARNKKSGRKARR